MISYYTTYNIQRQPIKSNRYAPWLVVAFLLKRPRAYFCIWVQSFKNGWLVGRGDFLSYITLKININRPGALERASRSMSYGNRAKKWPSVSIFCLREPFWPFLAIFCHFSQSKIKLPTVLHFRFQFWQLLFVLANLLANSKIWLFEWRFGAIKW